MILEWFDWYGYKPECTHSDLSFSKRDSAEVLGCKTFVDWSVGTVEEWKRDELRNKSQLGFNSRMTTYVLLLLLFTLLSSLKESSLSVAAQSEQSVFQKYIIL
jgi:hypothetical protein